MKHKRFVLPTVLLLILLAVIPTITHLAPPATHQTVTALPTPTQPALRQDAQVVAVMQRLGLDYSQLNLLYEQAPDVNTASLAAFTNPNTIYVSPGHDMTSMSVSVSHEYLHYKQLSDSSSTSFYPYLDNLHQSNTWLTKRMAPYYNGTACNGPCADVDRETEVIACTEMPDSALQPDFVMWCNKYLPERYSLF